MRDYRKLAVFPKAHALTLRIYIITRKFPRDELYGMVTEMRRSARSVPANLVEGCGKHTQKDLARYVDNSIGSANELLYYDLLARDLGYIDPETFDELATQIEEVLRMLTALARAIRTGPDLGDRPKPRPASRSTRHTITSSSQPNASGGPDPWKKGLSSIVYRLSSIVYLTAASPLPDPPAPSTNAKTKAQSDTRAARS